MIIHTDKCLLNKFRNTSEALSQWETLVSSETLCWALLTGMFNLWSLAQGTALHCVASHWQQLCSYSTNISFALSALQDVGSNSEPLPSDGLYRTPLEGCATWGYPFGHLLSQSAMAGHCYTCTNEATSVRVSINAGGTWFVLFHK